jgi:hypothetical protein
VVDNDDTVVVVVVLVVVFGDDFSPKILSIEKFNCVNLFVVKFDGVL